MVYPGHLESINQFQILLAEVNSQQKYLRLSEWKRLKILFTKFKKCLFIGCMLHFFQQMIGINVIQYYGPDIIIQAGFSFDKFEDRDKIGILLNLPLSLTNAIGSIIAMLYIDKIGRRTMVLRTQPVTSLAQFTAALCIYLTLYSENEVVKSSARIVMFLALIVFLVFFQVGMGSTPWTVNSEIFPLYLMGTANGITTATNHLSSFLVSSVLLSLTSTDTGKVVSFLVMGAAALLCTVFVYFLLPETANHKIEDSISRILGDSFIVFNEDL